MKISVVIPALNEEDRLEDTLQSVLGQPGPCEILVVDGGSEDATRQIAAAHAQVISAPRGRAVQINRGAAYASGTILLFLHADTLLPRGAFTAIRTALDDPRAEAGTFRLRFDRRTPLLHFYSLWTGLPWPLLCFGDRGLFLRRSVFDEVGGFPEMPMFEDLEMARRLHRRGGFCFLKQHVTTAARRFETYGPLRQQLRNTYLWLHYVAGTSPEQLAHLYPYRTHPAGPRKEHANPVSSNVMRHTSREAP